MNIKTDMMQIKGVLDARYNYDAMSLAIYYDEKANVNIIERLVWDRLDYRGLLEAVQKFTFISMPRE